MLGFVDTNGTFLLVGLAIFIPSLLAGISSFRVAKESDVEMFTVAGIFLILFAILSLVGLSLIGVVIPALLLFSGLITLIIVGIAFMSLGSQIGARNMKLAGVIILIGGILLIIIIGAILLMIGLMMGGRALIEIEQEYAIIKVNNL